MMQVRWVVKVPPRTKGSIIEAVEWLLSSGETVDITAARLIAEVFDVKINEGVKEKEEAA